MVKNNLVIVAAGKTSQHILWKPKCDRNFDLLLLNYENSDYDKDEYDYKFDVIGGFKYYLISKVPEILDIVKNYKNIWIPDDDLQINIKSINKMFQIFETFELYLAQPALTKNSPYTFPITVIKDNSILRFTNFVEVMCPIFSQKTFLKLYETFKLNKTSWGLDYLWPYLLNYPKNKIAIIDITPVYHYRPLKFNKDESHWNDLHEIFNKYPNIQKNQIEYGQISYIFY